MWAICFEIFFLSFLCFITRKLSYMRKEVLIIALLTIITFNSKAYSQGPSQTVKGRIIDTESQIGLLGASIIIENTDPIIGTTSDIDGYFRLEDIPVDNNEIVIRGNAAKGILWKLEGMEIPAPNHLAGMFSGGGVNTMFSSNMLDNSDFFTGA